MTLGSCTIRVDKAVLHTILRTFLRRIMFSGIPFLNEAVRGNNLETRADIEAAIESVSQHACANGWVSDGSMDDPAFYTYTEDLLPTICRAIVDMCVMLKAFVSSSQFIEYMIGSPPDKLRSLLVAALERRAVPCLVNVSMLFTGIAEVVVYIPVTPVTDGLCEKEGFDHFAYVNSTLTTEAYVLYHFIRAYEEAMRCTTRTVFKVYSFQRAWASKGLRTAYDSNEPTTGGGPLWMVYENAPETEEVFADPDYRVLQEFFDGVNEVLRRRPPGKMFIPIRC